MIIQRELRKYLHNFVRSLTRTQFFRLSNQKFSLIYAFLPFSSSIYRFFVCVDFVLYRLESLQRSSSSFLFLRSTMFILAVELIFFCLFLSNRVGFAATPAEIEDFRQCCLKKGFPEKLAGKVCIYPPTRSKNLDPKEKADVAFRINEFIECATEGENHQKCCQEGGVTGKWEKCQVC